MGSCRGQGSNSRGRGMKHKEYKILRFTDIGNCLPDMNWYAKQGFVIVKYETYAIHNAIWYSILMEREVDG